MSGYYNSKHMSYGNLPVSRQYAGCGPPAPCNGFVGSYIKPAYLARPCLPTFCSGYPEGAGASYTKHATRPQLYSQEEVKAKGVASRQLFEGNSCLGSAGCDGFDDVYVDYCRDIAYSDNLHNDYTNVLSTTWNQIIDVRGPVSCAPCTQQCPAYYRDGVYGYHSATPGSTWLGALSGTRASHIESNKPVRTFGY